MRKITALVLTAVLLVCAIQPVCAVAATDRILSVSPDQAKKSTSAQAEELSFTFVSNEPYNKAYYHPNSTDNSCSVAYAGQNTGSSPITVSVSSSNTDVLKITSGKTATLAAGAYYFESIKCDALKVGYADIIVSIGNTSYKQHVYVVPWGVSLSAPTQTDFHHIFLKWKKIPGCSGYSVQRISPHPCPR